jgi:hypothetical protein
MPKTQKSDFNFKIGADPEFVLTMQGRKVDAQQTMQLMLKNKEEFKPSTDGFKVGKYGNIGWDGAASTAEIRPSPENSPQKVINNIAKMLKALTKYIKICDMSTISEFSPTGGHIHLEIPKDTEWKKSDQNTIQRRLSSFYLPILISENKTNLNLRLRQGYGSIKDHRIEKQFKHKDGSDGYTIEFRAPSAEWLTTPKIAVATLSYIATVYHEIINHPKKFEKYNDIIFKSDKQGDALQTLAIMEFELLTNSILNKAKRYIKTFEMYPYYKKEIEYLFNPKQIIRDKQKANYDIAIGWKLSEKTILPKKSEILCNKRKIQNIAEKTDFDILKRITNVHYNNDTNVGLFAEALKDRVAAYNWKLKNNYYIFGMRKGMPEIIAKDLKGNHLTGTQTIKTRMDIEQVNTLFNRMLNKFNNGNSQPQGSTIDFLTGKPKDLRESTIIIGIPYEMRIKETIKPFLTFLWQLEKNSLPRISTKELQSNVIDDRQLELKDQGLLYKILTKQIEETPHIIIDAGSHSLRNNSAAINSEIFEQNNPDTRGTRQNNNIEQQTYPNI